MKPIVLYKDQDGRIVVTEDDIQKLVDTAYNQGYTDGSKANKYNDWISTPNVVPTWLGTSAPDEITISNENPKVTV